MSDNDSADGMLAALGAYEPSDAQRVIAELEKESIPFDVEADHSALHRVDRAIDLYLGRYPEGSKLVISVSNMDFDRANKVILERIFRV